ncbi:hypothetical protein EC988_001232 [Linderina pennispora]|nr:hypothetical protein EC988_001232 [Linderina pennispora]
MSAGVTHDVVNLRHDDSNAEIKRMDLLPCSIKYSGPAQTQAYFVVSKGEDQTEGKRIALTPTSNLASASHLECGQVVHLTYIKLLAYATCVIVEASFRGRRLCGRRIQVPEQFTGHVLVERVSSQCPQDLAFEAKEASATPVGQRELTSAGEFSEIVVWEHDRAPMDDDELISSLEWVEVAASIHADCSGA